MADFFQAECGESKVIAGTNSRSKLEDILSEIDFSTAAILCDQNTARDCLPKLSADLQQLPIITVPPGEKSKSLEIARFVWAQFHAIGFDRYSLLINLGGGMICDLGGFCASVYKRGIRFNHVPTSLLAMTDAAIGGKTGIDYENIKNHLGTFSSPNYVVVDPEFLATLSADEIRSGFAESMKHALIADSEYWTKIRKLDPAEFGIDLMQKSIEVKVGIVNADPIEKGKRKALNFGHTIGHAFEMQSVMTASDVISHGDAVAAGMLCESIISRERGMITDDEYQQIRESIVRIFPFVSFSVDDMQSMLQMIGHDKKNRDGKILATLLDSIGNAKINCEVNVQEIEKAIIEYKAIAG